MFYTIYSGWWFGTMEFYDFPKKLGKNRWWTSVPNSRNQDPNRFHGAIWVPDFLWPKGRNLSLWRIVWCIYIYIVINIYIYIYRLYLWCSHMFLYYIPFADLLHGTDTFKMGPSAFCWSSAGSVDWPEVNAEKNLVKSPDWIWYIWYIYIYMIYI